MLQMDGRVEHAGCSLFYRIEGEGEPVVFIQGVGLHGDGWLPQTACLRQRFRCLTFDNRGMSKSQPVGARISVEQMAADTLAVMDAAGVGAAHLVGHSLGGVVAQQIALTNSQRVLSLSLLCTSSRGADAVRLAWDLAWWGLRSRVGTRSMRRRAFLRIIMTKEYLLAHDREFVAGSLAKLFGHDLADSPPVAMRQLSALKRFDSSDRLATLAKIPSLVVSASHDIIFPPHSGRKLAAVIPGARYVEIPNAAHGVPIQCPDSVNSALAEHFDSVK